MNKNALMVLALTLWTVFAYSSAGQDIPAENPAVYSGEFFSESSDLEGARAKAMESMIKQIPWEKEDGALLYELSDKGQYFCNFENVVLSFIESLQPIFAVDTLSENNGIKCVCSVGIDAFNDCLNHYSDSLIADAERLFRSGVEFERNGRLREAAVNYSKSLNLIHPFICRKHIIAFDDRHVDLFRTVYIFYMRVFDGITMTTSNIQIPAVCSEGLPFPIVAKVKKDGLPLVDLKLAVDFNGDIETSGLSDDKGRVNINLNKVTENKPVQYMDIRVDIPALTEGIEDTFASERFRMHRFPEMKVKIYLFDPQVYVKIEQTPSDSTLYAAARKLLAETHPEFKLVESADSSDLLFQVRQETKVYQVLDNSRYKVTRYISAFRSAITVTETGQNLVDYSLADFQTLIPGFFFEEEAIHMASRKLKPFFCHDFKPGLERMVYDKRSLVWADYMNK